MLYQVISFRLLYTVLSRARVKKRSDGSLVQGDLDRENFDARFFLCVCVCVFFFFFFFRGMSNSFPAERSLISLLSATGIV